MTLLRSKRALILLLVTLVLIAQLASAAAAVASGQCSAATAEKVQQCLDQLESDEAKLDGGPCSSSDWRCICTKQQGFMDCYAPCPDQMSEDTNNFNKNNCAGQHDGITIEGLGGDLKYTWSNLDDILQGTTASTNGSGDAASGTLDPSTASSPAATSSMSSSPVPPMSTGATGNSSNTSTSKASGNTTTVAPSAAASSAMVVGGMHVALITVALSITFTLATAMSL